MDAVKETIDQSTDEDMIQALEDLDFKLYEWMLSIDKLESSMMQSGLPLGTFEWKHTFTPGIYMREIHMRAGTLLTSKIHNTEHPFVIMKGAVHVWSKDTGWVYCKSGHVGVTYPGTRRVLLVTEDCHWVTFHPNPENETDLDILEEKIIMKHENPLLPAGDVPYLLEK